MSYPLGIDLASFQGYPDFHEVKAAGYAFAITKATEGAGYINPTYDHNRTGAVTAKMLHGGYHFAHARGGAAAGKSEAAHFLAHLEPQPWHLLPSLDLEEQGSEGASGATLRAYAVAFHAAVCGHLELGKRRLILYTDHNMLGRGLDAPELRSRFLLWLAEPTHGAPHLPAGWRTVLHQFDWWGHVPSIGGGVDRDRALEPLLGLRIAAFQ